MKLSDSQIKALVEKVFQNWKSQNIVVFKVDEKKVFERAFAAIKAEFQKEADLEKECHKMLDDLERSNPGGFQRHKMFSMLKTKLAKEKKVIL